MTLRSSHRMYDVNPAVGALWQALFDRVSALSGVPLAPLEMPPPAPIDENGGGKVGHGSGGMSLLRAA